MSSKNALRRRKARMSSRSSLSLECLESRLALFAPIGNVNATLLGSTLLLTGDALDNALVVSTATGGRMAVLGGLGTTINGSTSAFVTSRAVTSIVANLNAGNDVIGFTNSAVGLGNQLMPFGIFSPFAPTLQADIDAATGGIPTFTLPGNVTVTTAAGNDAVGILGTVGGSVAANLGSSSSLAGPGQGNSFAIGDPFVTSVANRIGGSVSLVGGDQRDAVRIIGTNVNGVVAAALGNGENFMDIRSYGSKVGSFAYTGGTGDDFVLVQATPLTIRDGVNVYTGPRGEDDVDMSATSIGGSVVVNTGTGADDDDVRLRSDIRGGVSVVTGAGEDRVEVAGNVRRDVVVSTGAADDFVGVNSRSIGGSLVVNSGDGDDYLETFGDTIGGGVAINAGAGDDFIECEYAVGLNTVIDAGAGNDWVFSSGLTTRYNLFVYLGPGNDRLDLYNSSAFAAFLYGGTGANTLTTNAATRTGIRTLRYFQFQTVNNT